MTRLAEVLVQLENAPHIDLMILLVFGIDRIELSGGAAGSEQRGVEETGESFECASQGGGSDIEIIIGVRSRGVRIGMTVVLGEILRVDESSPLAHDQVAHLRVFVFLRESLCALETGS